MEIGTALPAVPTRAAFLGDPTSEWEQVDAGFERGVIAAFQDAALSVLQFLVAAR